MAILHTASIISSPLVSTDSTSLTPTTLANKLRVRTRNHIARRGTISQLFFALFFAFIQKTTDCKGTWYKCHYSAELGEICVKNYLLQIT